MNTQEQKKLSESLLAACKAAGIGMPRFIAQDKDGDIYHYKNKPFLKVNCDAWIHQNDGIYSGIDHPPYATNWQESLLEWVEPQDGEPLANVLARRPDHIADTSKMIPSGIEALVCADIAKRQQVGITKYGTTLENNPMTLIEGLQHLYEELLDAPIYCKNNIVRLIPQFEAMQAENERAKWIMRQLLNDLPCKRDWLDPDIEREMKALTEKGDEKL